MDIQENGIIIPYAISLQDIENGRDIDFESFRYGCQIITNAGVDEVEAKILMVAINWNCSIKFKDFYLPVVVRVYTHDHFMQFNDRRSDFAEIAGAVRNSFYKMKRTWQQNMGDSVLANALKDADEAEVARISNDILSEAEGRGYYN